MIGELIFFGGLGFGKFGEWRWSGGIREDLLMTLCGDKACTDQSLVIFISNSVVVLNWYLCFFLFFLFFLC